MPKKQKQVAVITGDVVRSTVVKDRARLAKVMKHAMEAIDKSGFGVVRPFEIYRGDSFQGVVEVKDAMKVALTIRARLRQWEGPVQFSAAGKTVRTTGVRMPIMLSLLPDARVAIGLGTVSYRSSKVVESDGEAYRNSGRALDELGRTWGRLALSTPWDDMNAEFGTSMRLLDALVGKWSSASAQAMFLYLTKGSTQSELSGLLGISQPAVHKRLSGADQSAVQAMIDRYEEVVVANLKR
jgi:hypothetical protein